MADRKRPKILIISTDKNLRDVLKFCFDGWGYDTVLLDRSPSGIAPIKMLSCDIIVVDVHGARRTDLEICRLLKDDFITAFIPVITLINKRQLRSQLLNIKQGVDDYLIKPPDPMDLRVRVEMAMKRTQYNFYASPLTGLPGGRIVEETLGQRLKSADPFAFGYVDLDNFKYFNDTYGYVKGDRAIMQTAYLLYTTITRFGRRGDFIGHIGGDDFAFMTSGDRYERVCHSFISEFNRIMPFHYSADDRKRGFITARDRTHRVKDIPLMSVSIAVVVAGRDSGYRSPVGVNEKIAEVKRYLKGFEGSKFMADRRADLSGAPRGKAERPRIFKIDNDICNARRPLGQILLAGGAITESALDEALVAHWKRGIRLGEILKSNGSVDARVLHEAVKLTEKSRIASDARSADGAKAVYA